MPSNAPAAIVRFFSFFSHTFCHPTCFVGKNKIYIFPTKQVRGRGAPAARFARGERHSAAAGAATRGALCCRRGPFSGAFLSPTGPPGAARKSLGRCRGACPRFFLRPRTCRSHDVARPARIRARSSPMCWDVSKPAELGTLARVCRVGGRDALRGAFWGLLAAHTVHLCSARGRVWLGPAPFGVAPAASRP